MEIGARTFFSLSFFMALFVSAVVLGALAENPNIEIYSVTYDPAPVEPGKYFTLWIEVYNNGTRAAQDLNVTLETKYPFSMDANEDTSKYLPVLNPMSEALFKYKIRVAPDAVDGDNEMTFKACIGGYKQCVTRRFDVSVAKSANIAELEVLLTDITPVPYPGGKSTMTIDIANIAPGTAYYTVLGAYADSEKIEITPVKTFIGSLDADDYDSVGLKLKFADDIEPGLYLIRINLIYKDENYKKQEANATIGVKVVTKEEALKQIQKQTPLWVYTIYLIAAVLIFKFVLWGWVKKISSFLSSFVKQK